jgi:hypothetical protein
MIKNDLRLTFKKKQRNPFLVKFKTEVRECNSIDAVRLTPIKTNYNSQSPIREKTVSRRFTGITTTIKGTEK